tara:strand:+ start:89 stop:376 length:288 start_codon:yes stop_codon:yes gene_type:complete
MRYIYQIALDIKSDWRERAVTYAEAESYLKKMEFCKTPDQKWLNKTARSFVVDFLDNAKEWRCGRAEELKEELRSLLYPKPETPDNVWEDTGYRK